jgi:hypothetical protein
MKMTRYGFEYWGNPGGRDLDRVWNQADNIKLIVMSLIRFAVATMLARPQQLPDPGPDVALAAFSPSSSHRVL